MTNQQRFLFELAELLKVKAFSEGDIERVMHAAERVMRAAERVMHAAERVMHAAERVYAEQVPPCLAKADQAEPVFILRGQDESAQALVRLWLAKNQQVTSVKYRAALQIIDAMGEWPHKKLTDECKTQTS
jgi:hypothetical protein